MKPFVLTITARCSASLSVDLEVLATVHTNGTVVLVATSSETPGPKDRYTLETSILALLNTLQAMSLKSSHEKAIPSCWDAILNLAECPLNLELERTSWTKSLPPSSA